MVEDTHVDVSASKSGSPMPEGVTSKQVSRTRWTIWKDGDVSLAVGEIPELTGVVAFTVTRRRGLDLYFVHLTAGTTGVLDNPFGIQVLDSGVLRVFRNDNGATLNLYGAGAWRELGSNIKEWDGPVYAS